MINKETEVQVGPIDSNYDLEALRKEPIGLPKGFEWSVIDLDNAKELD